MGKIISKNYIRLKELHSLGLSPKTPQGNRRPPLPTSPIYAS